MVTAECLVFAQPQLNRPNKSSASAAVPSSGDDHLWKQTRVASTALPPLPQARDDGGCRRLCGGDEFQVALYGPSEGGLSAVWLSEGGLGGQRDLPTCDWYIPTDGSAQCYALRHACCAARPAWRPPPSRSPADSPPSLPRPQSAVVGDVTDNEDGTYSVCYTASVAGVYELHITVGEPRGAVLLVCSGGCTVGQPRRLYCGEPRGMWMYCVNLKWLYRWLLPEACRAGGRVACGLCMPLELQCAV